MIIFVEIEEGNKFAFFNSDNNSFLKLRNVQVWKSKEEFKNDFTLTLPNLLCNNQYTLDFYLSLIPNSKEKIQVKVEYYKDSGKYYDTILFESEAKNLWDIQIVEEIKKLIPNKNFTYEATKKSDNGLVKQLVINN